MALNDKQITMTRDSICMVKHCRDPTHQRIHKVGHLGFLEILHHQVELIFYRQRAQTVRKYRYCPKSISLGWDDPLEKGKATHSSILAWRIPWTVYYMGSQRVGHNWEIFTFTKKKKILAEDFWKDSIFCSLDLVVRLLDSPAVSVWKPWLNNRQAMLKRYCTWNTALSPLL